MGHDVIGINLQSFLKVGSGCRHVAGVQGFLGAFVFFDGFGGDVELANRDRIAGRGRRPGRVYGHRGGRERECTGDGIEGIVGVMRGAGSGDRASTRLSVEERRKEKCAE